LQLQLPLDFQTKIKINIKTKTKINFKDVGQECPTHTCTSGTLAPTLT